jgi:nitroreductase
MNPKLDFIFSRRSIRKYQDKEVPEAMLTDLLEAAMAAPSAVAKDPWHFIVIKNRETLNKITTIIPSAKMLSEAPTALIICGDINKVNIQSESFLLQDLSAATENILIAANILGLGTCWLGIHPREDRLAGITELLGLPANIIPMCGVALGWPDEQPEARTRYNPKRVHPERW